MPVPAPVVTFVLGHLERDWPDIERLTESEIERQPSRFQGGRNSWIAQGYLRPREGLERLGCRVRVASCVPSAGIALVHRDDADDCRVERSGAFVMVVRADRAPVLACDLAVDALAPHRGDGPCSRLGLETAAVRGRQRPRKQPAPSRQASARFTISVTSGESPPAPATASSASRAWAWRPASNLRQRSKDRASREATCGLIRSSAIT